MTKQQPITSRTKPELISRDQLAKRWSVSKETIKRREREGLLSPVRFNQRLIRYRLDDILAIEQSLLS
ncbi:MAG: DNA-binding XRE family transcriptional regulator [Verrucomicrobiales bacterium]|jgi:DNA-binding XRE family transcriptional regulator